jgi:hypothetical protein
MKKRSPRPVAEPIASSVGPNSTQRVPKGGSSDLIAELARKVDLRHITKEEAIEQVLQAELQAVDRLLTSDGRADLEDMLRVFLDSDPTMRQLRRSCPEPTSRH